jgi:DNA-binding transcriptional ArsR family regulator
VSSEEVPARESEAPSQRRLTEVQELRALTHPVRIALLEVLNLHGPLTATEAGERLGESASTCSFHLRQLAKYGYVEEAGGASGRRRPWQLRFRGFSFSGEGDREHAAAANELSHLLLQRWLLRHQAWEAVQHREPEWSEVAGASQHVCFLTLEETARLQGQITALFEPYIARTRQVTARPEGSRPVETVVLVHPFLQGPDATASQ